MQASKIKGCAVVALLITMVAIFCANIHNNEETPVRTQYTVQKGDTLCSIAEDYGIKNWRKWADETCEVNDIKLGGLLYPGQIITIKVKE